MHVIRVLIVLSLTTVTKVYTVQVCGKALADVIDLVCSGRGFYTFNQRGTDHAAIYCAILFFVILLRNK
ncbi:hypothetical protein DPMN_052043 [Dreissena polymorpha]|uniref:Uncharacterized protein n=1 Tax=Dreissena polymorpha TaxID=45954 RepID=A0A9D4CL56_DREPO|nr:hypothetical protein DPMN_052043 [Dreissena polymorpha]